NPLQTPCEHSFCTDCINGWLSVDKTCPVDRVPLESKNLKIPSRVLRNLLNGLDIDCDFRHRGCQAIVKLENLRHHVSECAFATPYALNEEIVCNKGCNMKVTRQQYQTDDCISHLAKEITKLKNLLSMQQEQIEGLRYESDIFLKAPLTWQQTQNICIKEPNFLKMDENPNFNFGFAQSDHALEPMKSFFKIHLTTSLDSIKIWVGLTRKEFSPKCIIEKQTIRYQGLFIKDDIENNLVLVKCKNDDVIECGIEFSIDFRNELSVPIYLLIDHSSSNLICQDVVIDYGNILQGNL
ncbi:E3 ubiquitin-protein ligase NRDP1, partial [Pseudolycoriella hygida]